MKRCSAILITLLIILSVATGCSRHPALTESPTISPTSAPTAAPTEALSWNEMISRDFDKRITETQFTGTVYATYKGEEFYAFGNGKADKTAGIANSADTVFYAASLTKQFTAAAVLRLCDQGKLNLDDTLSKYFPDYTAGANVTLHQLLSMQSGIADYVRIYDDNGNETDIKKQSDIPGLSEENSSQANRKAVEQFIFSQPLLFEPGDRYSYSNSNYVLLGGVIEQAADVSWFDYIETNFFEPLGLDSAGFSESYNKDGFTVAKPYHREDGGEYMRYSGAAFACGDLMISARDMACWTDALHTGKVLSNEMYKLMTTLHCKYDIELPETAAKEYTNIGYGYGLDLLTTIASDTFYHIGHINSYYSLALSVPDSGFTMVLMSNYARFDIESVAALMLQDYLIAYNEAALDCYPYSPTLPQ